MCFYVSQPGCSSWHSPCRAWEGLLRIWVGPGWAVRASTPKTRLPNLPERQWWTNTGQRAKFGIAFSRDFLAFCRGFKEKWVSLLEGNVEMLETQYSLQRWGERLWALFFQKNRESPHGLGNVKWAGYTSSFLILLDRVEERLNLLCGCSTSVGHWDALKMSEVDCVVYCGQMHGKD